MCHTNATRPCACPTLSLLQVDKALVNVGSMFLETVTGRVSTEVDPRIAYDTGAEWRAGHAGWLGAACTCRRMCRAV